MAALPEKTEGKTSDISPWPRERLTMAADAVMEDPSGGVALNPSEIKTSAPAADAKPQQAHTESTGGNKKKKKGKK